MRKPAKLEKQTKKKLGPKGQLMDTAIDLFAEKGFNGTSIRDIANAMGVSASSIYHFFGNKEGLWVAILRYSVEELPAQLREVSQLDMDPVERFELLVRTHLKYSEHHRRESKILMIDEGMLTPEGQRINRKLQTEIMDIYLEQLQILKNLGYIQTPHLKVAAFNIFGVLNWMLRWYRPGGKLGEAATYDEVINFIMQGLIGSRDRKAK